MAPALGGTTASVRITGRRARYRAVGGMPVSLWACVRHCRVGATTPTAGRGEEGMTYEPTWVSDRVARGDIDRLGDDATADMQGRYALALLDARRELEALEAERDRLRKERDVAYEHLREWARIGGGLRFCSCRYMTTRTGLMHEKACPTAAALAH